MTTDAPRRSSRSNSSLPWLGGSREHLPPLGRGKIGVTDDEIMRWRHEVYSGHMAASSDSHRSGI